MVQGRRIFFFWLESSFIRKVIVLIEFCICCLDASIVWILCRKVELTVRDLALTVPKLCEETVWRRWQNMNKDMLDKFSSLHMEAREAIFLNAWSCVSHCSSSEMSFHTNICSLPVATKHAPKMPQNNLCFFSLIVVFKPTRVAHRLARRYVLGQPLKKLKKN